MKSSRIGKVSRTGELVTSFAQQRLWFLAQLEELREAYHIPFGLQLDGEIDEKALTRSLDRLVARHEALRTTFYTVDGEVFQKVAAEEATFPLRRDDLRGFEDRETRLASLLREEARAPFDLEQGPLVRGRLIDLHGSRHVLLITMHHIVSDGWSTRIFIRELTTLYGSYARGRDDPLPPLEIQYADYAAWQRQWLSGERLAELSTYWRRKMRGAPAFIELPTDRCRPAQQDVAGGYLPFVLDEKLTNELGLLSRHHGLTPFMTILAGWSLVLSRLSDQEEVVIGTPSANRVRSETEGLIGFFVNTLPLRVDLSGAPTVEQLLRRVKETTQEAQAHQALPFERIVSLVNPVRSLTRTPIFQVMFSWNNDDEHTAFDLPDLRVTGFAVGYRPAQFDLTLTLRETDGRVVGGLTYVAALFDADTIDRYAGYLRKTLSEMVKDARQVAVALPLLLPAERHRLLVEWNETEAEYPRQSCIHELIEQQALETPDAIAAVYEGRSLSYGELNARSNQLAQALMALGVKPDDRIAICVERSLEMVVGLLGTLKAGGAYVPLDPEYPAERLRYMLEDSTPGIILTHAAARNRLQAALDGVGVKAKVLDLEQDAASWITQRTANPDGQAIGLTPRHLAYVIYTSGSTGKPKGVMIEHGSLVNRIVWMHRAYGLDQSDTVIQKTPFSFDVSVWEFFWPLMAGARLVLAKAGSHKDPLYISTLVNREHVTTLHFVPSALGALFDENCGGSHPGVTRVFCSGEALSETLVARFPDHFENARLYNLYGPTEAAIDVTAWDCGEAVRGTTSIPIGRPIANTRIYLLDEIGQPVPVGVVGELYIGGVGVARGYLNRPDLTAERFIESPFVAGDRLYKTGDLSRYLPDGNIEFLGRNDFQVKIRGFRIELGEIEARLSSHPAVSQAIVVAREDMAGDKRLVAYYTAAGDEIGVQALREHLLCALPDYMVPAAYMRVEAFPLTPNGKLDRNALPVPDSDSYGRGEYEAPRGELERTLAAIWSEVLGLERIGRHDSFFALGGHSLLAIRMVERLRRAGFRADVRMVFTAPTLADLAAAVGAGSSVVCIPPNGIEAGCERITPEQLPLIDLTQDQIDAIVATVPGGSLNVQDIYPLAPLQEGILFHHLMEVEGDPYLVWYQVSFSDREVLDQYLAALNAVVARHDILRTSVVWEGLPVPVQVVWRHARVAAEEIALDPEEGAIGEQLQSRFNPRHYRLNVHEAPLIHLVVARDPSADRWVAMTLYHHLCLDHESLEILHGEIGVYMAGNEAVLPQPSPFRNLVARAQLGVTREEHEAFFRAMLGDVTEPTAPFGVLDVQGDGTGILEAHRHIDPNLCQRLRMRSRALGVSPASLCHVAWGLVLARTSGQQHPVFGTVLFGRMQGGEDTGRVIGPFINTLPVRVHLGDLPAEQSVVNTHRALASLLRHEHASLVLAQRCSAVEAPTPLFTALLNYRHSRATSPTAVVNGIRSLAYEERTNYPVTLSIDDFGERLVLTAQSISSIDPQRLCGMMHRALEELVTALETRSDRPIGLLEVLPPAERHQLLVEWNATQAEYPRNICVHHLFEQQALEKPDAMAAVYEGRSLSYRELRLLAGDIAARIQQAGVGTNELVGIRIGKSLEQVVAALGVLMSGAAYLPVDPGWPVRQQLEVLEQGRVRVLLRHTEDSATVPIEMKSITVDASRAAPYLVPKVSAVSATDVAYVIFTSGSTGKPKGVTIDHRAVVNTIVDINRRFDVTARDRVLALSALTFDLSVYDVLGVLAAGGCVVLPAEADRGDPGRWAELARAHGVTVWNSVPALFQLLIEHLEGESLPGGRALELRVALLSGDWIPTQLPARARRQLPGIELHSLGGATEASIWSVTYPIGTVQAQWASIPYGRPLHNQGCLVLDGQLQLCPIGVVGDLYLTGEGLARGYWEDETRTAASFFEHPRWGIRMYRTGDRARWLQEGNLEFLGRLDDQVKIRGFRIELGEIEAQLLSQEEVSTAVVVVRGTDANKQLVAYIVPAAASRSHGLIEKLQAHLQAQLPSYMVPAFIVLLDRLPLTANGKLDRKALPLPDGCSHTPGEYEAPVGELEKALAAIWSEVLQVERIGRHDSFFALGGQSLLVVRLVLRINKEFSRALRVMDVYRSSTIADMAAHLATGRAASEPVDLMKESALDRSIFTGLKHPAHAPGALLLTGCTGFVGRFLLERLLLDTDETIYCLVRARTREEGLGRLKEKLLKFDLWGNEAERRIVVVPGDLSSRRLGLDETAYGTLIREVKTIYHCGSSMNHLETYAMAKQTNVEGAKELVALAALGAPKLINYISTLGVFGERGDDESRILSEDSRIDDQRHSSSSGYTASKWVGEKIFLTAQEHGIPCNIFRLGLVWADSQQGRYDELQREDRVIKSCLISGYGIQNYAYEMAPTPVDYVARAVVYLANRHQDGNGIFHVCSTDMEVHDVFECCNDLFGTSLTLMPRREWISEIRRRHHAGQSLPAMPLADLMSAEADYRESTSAWGATRVSCLQTVKELEGAGIAPPAFDHRMIKVYLDRLWSRDADVRASLSYRAHNSAKVSARRPLTRSSLQG